MGGFLLFFPLFAYVWCTLICILYLVRPFVILSWRLCWFASLHGLFTPGHLINGLMDGWHSFFFLFSFVD